MTFEAALAGNRAPSRVGDVVLRYDKSLLIGESRRIAAYRYAPEAAFVGGAGASFAAVSVLVMPQDALSAPLAIIFAILAAVLLIGAAFLERRVRRPRRFVLNFATEALRMENSNLLGRRTVSVHFDAVKDLRIEAAPRSARRVIVYFEQPGQRRAGPVRAGRFILIDDVRAEDDKALDRAFRLFKGAFGLGVRPAAEGPASTEERDVDLDRFDSGED